MRSCTGTAQAGGRVTYHLDRTVNFLQRAHPVERYIGRPDDAIRSNVASSPLPRMRFSMPDSYPKEQLHRFEREGELKNNSPRLSAWFFNSSHWAP